MAPPLTSPSVALVPGSRAHAREPNQEQHAQKDITRELPPIGFDDLAPPVVDCSGWGGPGFDWSPWYLNEEDDVGQSPLQGAIIYALLSSLRVLVEERRQSGDSSRDWAKLHIDYDNYFAWDPERPKLQVSPDVFTIHDPPVPRPSSYKTWLPGHNPPGFALEVVSAKWEKDYLTNIERYAQLGTRELIIADPASFTGRAKHPIRAPFVRYERTGDGQLKRTYVGLGPVWSTEIASYVRFVVEDGEEHVRLFRDQECTHIVPTSEELVHHERRRAESAEKRAADLATELRALQRRLDAESQ